MNLQSQIKSISKYTKDLFRTGVPNGRSGYVPFMVLIAIYSLSVVTSLPGLAISPILADLQNYFKGASELKIQMLESLPSLVIIPFILLSGGLSVRFDNRKLLFAGLGLFFLSSVLYMVSHNLNFMLFNSVLLGVGAGVVIPLSTGLVANYFDKEQRTRQLGVVSAISNFALVGATMLAGFLAGINWKYSFLVYTISIISILLVRYLKKPTDKPAQNSQEKQVKPVIDTKKYEDNKFLLHFGIRTVMPINIMLFYFFITILVLVIPFDLAIYTQQNHTASVEVAGTMISVFFLSITIPGLLINRVKKYLGSHPFTWGVLVMTIGISLLLIPNQAWLIWIGIIFAGFGYGILQPLIYDKTADSVPADKVTFALSLVMSMNYIAIILYPFFQQLQTFATRWNSAMLPFIVSAAMGLIYVIFGIRNMKNKA